MTEPIVPAEIFPPGEFIKDELEARGWIQEDLAEIMNCTPRLVSEIISSKRSITPNTARGLGQAFGTSAQVWMNLEGAHQLHKLGQASSSDNAIAMRSRLFDKAPVRDMVNRGWLEQSDNPEVTAQQILQFFEIETISDDPKIWGHAARKATCYDEVSPAQLAWLCRVRQLARAVNAGRYTEHKLRDAIRLLKRCLVHPNETRHAPSILAEAGVRLVVAEHLKGTRIDGATLWLDKRSPVVALSLRYDRIDCFWFTLFHELYHVQNGDGLMGGECPLDVRLVGNDRKPSSEKSENEKRADEFSAKELIDRDNLDGFILRVGPLYSKIEIRRFAKLEQVHPGIVVGQLQHRGEIPWTHNREMLVKVKNVVTQSTLTDGWGCGAPPVN